LPYFGKLGYFFALLNNDHSFLIEDSLNGPDSPVYLSQRCYQNWYH